MKKNMGELFTNVICCFNDGSIWPIGLMGLSLNCIKATILNNARGGGPKVVVSTAAFYARVRGLVPGLGGLKETKMFLPHPRVKVSIVGSLRDREVACSASDRQGSNFESCVLRTVSSNHLTILRFSWPSLAYMCTKVAQSPIHFISFHLHNARIVTIYIRSSCNFEISAATSTNGYVLVVLITTEMKLNVIIL